MRRFYIKWRTKNPRRELILTGIYANNSKLKYGVDEIRTRGLCLDRAAC